MRNRGIDKLQLAPSVKSYHHMLVLGMSLQEEKKGPGTWKFNNTLLEDRSYVAEVINEIRKARMGAEGYTDVNNPGLLIETL